MGQAVAPSSRLHSAKSKDASLLEDWTVIPLPLFSQPSDRLVSLKGGDPAAGSPTATLLRLHPSRCPHLRRLPPKRVSRATSGEDNSHGVTGGVYKARERIHRCLLISDY